jgi:acyl-CoA synthetase (AMP-forming)/AMP-acid ligase II
MTPSWLDDRLSVSAARAAMVHAGTTWTYAQLGRSIDLWQRRLAGHGIRRGEVVAFVGDHSPATCALLFALTRHGNVCVPFSRAAAARLAEHCRIAGVDSLFELDREGAPWRRLEKPARPAPHPLLAALRATGRAGLVLFSSGSTGASKASLLDLERLMGRFAEPRRPFVTLGFLLADHIGGLNTLLSVLSSGGCLVSAASERSPEAVCAAIERHRVQLLPTTPTFLRMLLISEAFRSYDLSSLELITYGTEPMPESTLRELHETFPAVRLKQTYGLTELGILSTRSADSGSLWVQVGGAGYETKVVDGVLWIRSQTAMLGYLNAASPFDRDGWFNTQDAVEVKGDQLRILGRTSELINVGGEKVYPAQVECVLLDLPNVLEATAWGKPSPVTGQVVAATLRLAVPEERTALLARLQEHCRGRLPAYQVPVFLELAGAPVHNERFKKIRVQAAAAPAAGA